MKSLSTQKKILVVIAILLLAAVLAGGSLWLKNQKLPVRVLILPKFEVGEVTGDFPGEAQLFYEEYLDGGDVYEIGGFPDNNKLYYRNGIALCQVGQGKINAALGTSAILSDERFDFSDAYILSVGCGGTAEGYGILGDGGRFSVSSIHK